jgi:hypothetical protein
LTNGRGSVSFDGEINGASGVNANLNIQSLTSDIRINGDIGSTFPLNSVVTTILDPSRSTILAGDITTIQGIRLDALRLAENSQLSSDGAIYLDRGVDHQNPSLPNNLTLQINEGGEAFVPTEDDFPRAGIYLYGYEFGYEGYDYGIQVSNLTIESPSNLPIDIKTLSDSPLQVTGNLSIRHQSAGGMITSQPLSLDSDIQVTGNTNIISDAAVTIPRGRINGDLFLSADNILAPNDIFSRRSSQLSVGGDINLQAINDITGSSSTEFESQLLSGGSMTFSAGRDIALNRTQLNTDGAVSIEATGSIINGIQIFSNADIELRANNQINLNDRDSLVILEAQGNLSLSSDGDTNIQGRSSGASYLYGVTSFSQRSGGDTNLDINLISGRSTIVSSGNIRFGDYSGPALKVEAGGSIEGGNIRIFSPNFAETGSDPDSTLLRTSNAVILRAGIVPSSGLNAPIQVYGTQFLSTSSPSMPASIQVGNIDTSSLNYDSLGGPVILSAPGNISTGNVTTQSPFPGGLSGLISITSGGNILTGSMSTRSNNSLGNDINLSAQSRIDVNGSIDARGYEGGGNITISSGDRLRVLGSVETSSGLSNSVIEINQGSDLFGLGAEFDASTPDEVGGVSGQVAITIATDATSMRLIEDVTLMPGESIDSRTAARAYDLTGTSYPLSESQLEAAQIRITSRPSGPATSAPGSTLPTMPTEATFPTTETTTSATTTTSVATASTTQTTASTAPASTSGLGAFPLIFSGDPLPPNPPATPVSSPVQIASTPPPITPASVPAPAPIVSVPAPVPAPVVSVPVPPPAPVPVPGNGNPNSGALVSFVPPANSGTPETTTLQQADRNGDRAAVTPPPLGICNPGDRPVLQLDLELLPAAERAWWERYYREQCPPPPCDPNTPVGREQCDRPAPAQVP